MARWRTTIMIELTPQAAAAIDKLVKTGLFGANRQDAVDRLLCRALIDALPLTDQWAPSDTAKVVRKKVVPK